MIRDMWEDGWAGRLILFVGATLILLFPVAIYGAIQEGKQWDQRRSWCHAR